MTTDLLEREAPLAEFEAALEDAAAGHGCLVLVSGEAGAGKTTLVRRVADGVVRGRVLSGMCDDLTTPRPLGPFRDIALEVGGLLEQTITSVSATDVADALLEELDQPPRPAILMIEDVHWADEASLDMLRFLGRRIDRLPVLLVLTFRHDEMGGDHPLRVMLGSVPADSVQRIELQPLSLDAVRSLAGGRLDAEELYRLTGGNPFYVTEMLASPDDASVPPTVQEAVMARIRRLDTRGRECAETASVIPTRIDRSLLDSLGLSPGIDEAVGGGVLNVEGDHVSFSHELVRQAVEASLMPTRREDINRRVLDTLIASDAHPAQLAHHASQANDAEAIARFAPVAARRAARLDSHREAVAHFRQALSHPETYSPGELAALLFEYARECYLTESHEEAAEGLQRAIDLHCETGDPEAYGDDLTLLSEVYWFLGRGAEAAEAATRAVETLEALPASEPLAWAYAQKARLALVDRRTEEALAWGDRAVALARDRGDTEALVHALNTVGSARWFTASDQNQFLLESLETARTHRLNIHAGRAYANLVDGYLHHLDLRQAERYLEEGLAFCDAHDLVTASNRLGALRSGWALERGRWEEAEDLARQVEATGDVTRVITETVLGLLAARRGDASAGERVDRANELAERISDTQDLLPAGLALLELAWLSGDTMSMSLARRLHDLARQTESARWIGETSLWMHRAGALVGGTPPEAMDPYSLHVSGRWQEAANAWEEIGRPYAQADALADAPEPTLLLQSLEILYELGAAPRAGMVRRRLRKVGVTRIPRGPRAETKASPAGLTARQTEVLELLAQGLTYEEIADRLYVSTKTVDHHLSAVRLKLGVSTRQEAVEVGRRLGILP